MPVTRDPGGTVYAALAGSTQAEVKAMSPFSTLPYAPKVVPGAVAVAPPAKVTGPSAVTLYAASHAPLQLNVVFTPSPVRIRTMRMVFVSAALGLTKVTESDPNTRSSAMAASPSRTTTTFEDGVKSATSCAPGAETAVAPSRSQFPAVEYLPSTPPLQV